MLATNLILLLAFVAMIAGALWLFRDEEKIGAKPPLRLRRETEDEQCRQQVRIQDNDSEPAGDETDRR